MSEAQKIPKITDHDGYHNCLKECCLVGTVDVLYVPQLKELVSPYGSTKLPKEYSEHPQLALFYYSYMINKNTASAARSELTFEWPKPYVVLNTIVKRLESHIFVVRNKYTQLPSIVKKHIGEGIECPTNDSIEELTPFLDPRKRHPIIIRLGPKREALDFFTELTDLEAAQSKYENLSKLEVRISCRQWFGSSLDVERSARTIRRLWLLEMVMSRAESIQQAAAAEDQEPTVDNESQGESSGSGPPIDHAAFWDELSQLERNQLLLMSMVTKRTLSQDYLIALGEPKSF
uniref:PKW1 plasmid n=1 Tax=Kluyveromyces waltii TaxID=4914 RepID=Q01090_KLUWA|nr:unnamed protein product [Lachancea waltii]